MSYPCARICYEKHDNAVLTVHLHSPQECMSRDSDQLTKEQYQHVTVYYTPNLISNNNGENSPRATNDFSFDAAKIVSTKLDVT